MNFDAVELEQLQAIFENYCVELSYLFGSRALGKKHNASDIDIGVLLSRNISAEERFSTRLRLIEELETFFKKHVDVVVLNDISSVFFQYVIIKEGNLLYVSPDADRIDFELRVMNNYFDFAPFLEEYNKRYLERHHVDKHKK